MSTPPISIRESALERSQHTDNQSPTEGIEFAAIRGEQKEGPARLKCEFTDCKRKINPLYLSIHTCACSKVFCQTHKIASVHNCTFDYRARERERLQRSIQELQSRKSSFDDHHAGSNHSH